MDSLIFFVEDYKDKFKHKSVNEFPRFDIKDLNGIKPIQEIQTPITGALLAYKIFQDRNYCLVLKIG